MKHTLRLLNLEDNQNDSELVHARLAEEGVECDLVRVETREEFVAAITQGGFDLILADYSLPSFDGLSALKIAKETCPEIPFIFVSGAIGEEVAIETLKRGATDYVLKDRLSRLAGAIKRALKEAEEQIKLKQAEEALRRSYEELEIKVEERTAELQRTNEILRVEIIERKRLEEKLHAASITDELTGLLNRRGFLTFAQKQLEIARREMRNFSILYLDLNELKRINDEFGHKVGDQALVDISGILRKTFRASDIIARFGGDEFTVLITEPRNSEIEKTVAEHIQDNLRIHNLQTGKGHELSVSMGMVHYDHEQPCSVEELLARADELMYEHKQQHKLNKGTIPSSKGGKRGERVYIRYETDSNNSVELVVSGNAMIKNISIGGISMKTSQKLAKNTVCTVKMLDNRNEELMLKGLVVWSSCLGRISEKGGTEPYYEAGLRFIELNDSLISSLEKLIIDLAN